MNATVKRKFNALLQGIGNNRPSPPPSSYSSPTSVSDPNRRLPSRDANDSTDGLLAPESSPRAAAASLASSPAPAPSTSSYRMGNESELLAAKKRRVAGPGTGMGTDPTTPSKYGGTMQGERPGGLTQTPPPPRVINPVGQHTTISNITLRRWTPTAPGAKGDGGPLKYCPGDREQLLRRLATFQELTDWTPKPERVSEIEWAKRGWVCQGKERVKCTLCASELVVKINRKQVDGKEISVLIVSEIAQSVVEKYAEMMVTSHAEDCLWRKKGCDGECTEYRPLSDTRRQRRQTDQLTVAIADSLLRLPLPNSRSALETLRQRYDELCERKDFLPYEFNLRLPEHLNLDTILSYLPPTFFSDPPPPPPTNKGTSITTKPSSPPHKPNRSALALALLGWQGLSNSRIGPVPNSASCHTCLRRLGLWMFKSKEIDLETNAVIVPAPMDHLDPLREHRFFCPWKNGAAQRNPGSRPLAAGEQDKPGWEILLQVLRNEAFIRQRTSVAHSRSKSSVPPRTTTTTTLLAAGPGDGSSSRSAAAGAKTPERPITSAGYSLVEGDGDGDEAEDNDDEEARKKKDQAMMSRLRRVKSLFNTKAGNKLKRFGSSRPGTAHSNTAGE